MASEHKSTRLGDLLVEQGVITHNQLLQAVGLQQTRRHEAVQANVSESYKQELGEVLIELGFINRSQLNSGLGWQQRLRKTTAVMVFIAPLLTAACGGGSSVGVGNNNTQSLTPRSQNISSQPVVDKPAAASSIAPVQNNSSVDSSRSVSSSIVAPVSSSSFSSNSSSLSSSTSSSTVIDGPVQVYWIPPNQRENGNFLDITEIGGYELRYKRKTDSRFTSIIINDSHTDAYYFDNLQGDYEFEIAAFDITGLYSAFVPVKSI